VLDRVAPPARQMALALEGRDGLDAVHVIAHGAPGRVSFAAGEWSAQTLEDNGVDLATIGRRWRLRQAAAVELPRRRGSGPEPILSMNWRARR